VLPVQFARNQYRFHPFLAICTIGIGPHSECSCRLQELLRADYLHGLFENAAVLKALFGTEPPPLDLCFDRLAGSVEAAFTRETLLSLLG
jgi:hypothetical protein